LANSEDKLSKDFLRPDILIEEFRQKIANSLNKERERIKEISEKEVKSILNKANQDYDRLIISAKEESMQIVNSAKEQAEKDAEILMAQIQIKADQIVKNAEESYHKDAWEKTKKEFDSVISDAHHEAKTINSKTLEQSKIEAKEILEHAKNEAALNAKQIRANSEKESRELILAASEMKQKASTVLTDYSKKAEESANIIIEKEIEGLKIKAETEAREIIEQQRIITQKEKDFIIEAATAEAKRAAENESTRMVISARQEAENMIATGKERLRTQLEQSGRLIAEMQQKMLKVVITDEPVNQLTKQNSKPSSNEGEQSHTDKPSQADKYCLLDNYT
jgi:vacuolar-type H+-ATPase subunit H